MDLTKIPQLPQRQDDLTAQLKDLAAVADRLGMYDAADAIRRQWLTPKEPEVRWLGANYNPHNEPGDQY